MLKTEPLLLFDAYAMKIRIDSLDLEVPAIMGILNVTPDSFSDGGKFDHVEAALERAREMKRRGAHIIDVGGESTRPGAETLAVVEELERVMPVIEVLLAEGLGPLSIDTRKAEVMEAAAEAGVAMINDVSALTFDGRAIAVAAHSQLPTVLMHSFGDPKTMQANPTYDDVVEEIYSYLAERLETCERAGLDRSLCIVDPGIGFGKTLDHNLVLLANLDRFQSLGVPVMLGASRKSFIGKASRGEEVHERIGGSIASVLAGLERGVQIFRVHDVMETAQAINIWCRIEEIC